MKIKALEKQTPHREIGQAKEKPKKRTPKALFAPDPQKVQLKEPVKIRGVHQEVILVRCNALLYETIKNMVVSSHTAQDFTFASPTEFIRSALQAYRDGMELTELDEKGEKTTTTVRVDQATKQFHSSLPDRLRSKLTERAIRTFMKRRMAKSR